jgi:hypothetical protein
MFYTTICFNLNVVQAQVHNGAELYIGDNSILHDSGSFNFGSGTITAGLHQITEYYLWGWRILDRS